MNFPSRLTRAREDDCDAPPRAVSLRRRIQLEPPRDETHEIEPGTDEAYRYVSAVEREFLEFAYKPEKYAEFISVLVEFKRRSLHVSDVVERMEDILAGHPYCIRGFNSFLPGGYRVRDLQRTF